MFRDHSLLWFRAKSRNARCARNSCLRITTRTILVVIRVLELFLSGARTQKQWNPGKKHSRPAAATPASALVSIAVRMSALCTSPAPSLRRVGGWEAICSNSCTPSPRPFLALYPKWGADSTQKLCGMYNFPDACFMGGGGWEAMCSNSEVAGIYMPLPNYYT